MDFKNKNLFFSRWIDRASKIFSADFNSFVFEFKQLLKQKDFSKMSPSFLKKILIGIGIFFLVVFFIFFFKIYVPANPFSRETIVFTAEKGWGDEHVARELEKLGIIRDNYFFRFYVVMSFQHSKLQAGIYNLSPRMSTYQIVKKMVRGDVIKDKITILEGWTAERIGEYFEEKNFCTKDYFIQLTEKDYSETFDFLKDKPKDVGLEGYFFPDTFEVSENESCEILLTMMLSNFGKKVNQEIVDKIKNQNKTIFEIITMASMIEKEVKIMEEKKIVSGILWKRLSVDMPLQIDATVNYVTGKSDSSALIKDTQIDSPYNTYKYKGLPKGPISNPGMNSILAAIYPTETKYWFYLSNGKTIFSETFEQHKEAKLKYLK
jgi:UPF0755 protein